MKRVFLISTLFLLVSLSPAYGNATPATSQTNAQLSPQFMQWCNEFMRTKGGNGQCKLACETKNPGAQVVGSISKQFGGTSGHSNNNTAIFPSVVHGIAAHVALIRDMCTRGRRDACGGSSAPRPRCTLIELKQVWAPSCHGNNNPASYANTVANWVGIPANQVFNPNDMEQMAKIALASARVEVGFVNYTCEQLAQGVMMAYGKIPPGAVPADVGTTKSLASLIEGQNSPLSPLLNGTQLQNGNQNQNPFASQGQWAQQSPQTGSSNSSGSAGAGDADMLNQLMQKKQQDALQQFVPQSSVTSRQSEEDSDTGDISCAEGKVEWSCDSTATVSRGLSKPTDQTFKTRGALVGSLSVAPRERTTYTIQCLKRQTVVGEHSCVMQPKRKAQERGGGKPVLTLEVEDTEVSRGDSTKITWGAVRVDSCVVYGEGLSEEGVEGSIETDALYTRGAKQYVLECQTSTGDVVSKSVDVYVR